MRSSWWLLVSVAVVVLAGCVDTSPDRVRLTGSVKNVALSVTAGSLVTSLSGTFDLELHVGDLAAGSATIAEPPTFQLVLAKDQSTLKVLDTGPTVFPITVKSGEHRTLSLTLADKNTLNASDISLVCAGPVQVTASLQDSLTADRGVTFESSPAPLTGCP